MLVVQLHQAGTEISATPLDGLVVDPLVLAKGLCCGVVRAPSQAVGFWLAIGCGFEEFMSSGDLRISALVHWPKREKGTNLRIQRLDQRLLRIPGTVDLTPARLLRARQRNGIGSALGRVLSQFPGASQMGRLRKEHGGGDMRFWMTTAVRARNNAERASKIYTPVQHEKGYPI